MTPAQRRALWDKHIHAFVAFCEPEASGAHGPRDGALSGMTVGVKDVINVAGMQTRNGSAACATVAAAATDAPIVARLRAAGAKSVGKTTTTEFAYTDPTACRNPHDLARSPGGSSSGSGAAVAAGLVDVALGTQTAGSLCRPAAYCGVVGLKPSYGVLPTAGVTPLAPSFDTPGIIATSVATAKAAFDVMRGEKARPKPPEVGAVQLAHGLFDGGATVLPATQAALVAALQALDAIGMKAAPCALVADVDRIVIDHRCVMNFEAAQAHGAMLRDDRCDLLQPNFRAALRSGAATQQDEYDSAQRGLEAARAAFWRGIGDIDIILTLPVPEGAPLIDGTTGFQNWLTPWTVFGGPLLSLPWGLDQLGRPRAVMLAGKPGADDLVMRVGQRLEARAPKIPPPQLPAGR